MRLYGGCIDTESPYMVWRLCFEVVFESVQKGVGHRGIYGLSLI